MLEQIERSLEEKTGENKKKEIKEKREYKPYKPLKEELKEEKVSFDDLMNAAEKKKSLDNKDIIKKDINENIANIEETYRDIKERNREIGQITLKIRELKGQDIINMPYEKANEILLEIKSQTEKLEIKKSELEAKSIDIDTKKTKELKGKNLKERKEIKKLGNFLEKYEYYGVGKLFTGAKYEEPELYEKTLEKLHKLGYNEENIKDILTGRRGAIFSIKNEGSYSFTIYIEGTSSTMEQRKYEGFRDYLLNLNWRVLKNKDIE